MLCIYKHNELQRNASVVLKNKVCRVMLPGGIGWSTHKMLRSSLSGG